MYHSKKFSLLLLSVLLLSFNSCSLRNEEKPILFPPRDLTLNEKSLVTSFNAFGLQLFSALSQSDSAVNLFISPLSVSMALGMTMNGAADSTYKAMQTTLSLVGLTEAEINESYQSLVKLLIDLDPNINLLIANSIWYRTGLPVSPDFIKTDQNYFSAQVKELNFLDPQAVSIINNWVNQKTNGAIQKIIKSIPSEMIMYLVNAIYFKGQWRTPFDKQNTSEGAFHNLDGSESIIPLMSQEMLIACLFDERFTLVDIPYSDSLYSMTILLPNDNQTLSTVSTQIKQVTWNQWISQLSPRRIQLTLPRFEIEYEKKLNEILSVLGMSIAFDPNRADFSRIADVSENVYISEVKHKTYLKVDEKGTTAAAVTSVGIGVTSAPQAITINRPFILAIRENHSGTLLFIGKITTL
ncbi:MAG: serpin family protein [Fidelibacterota bacterium]